MRHFWMIFKLCAICWIGNVSWSGFSMERCEDIFSNIEFWIWMIFIKRKKMWIQTLFIILARRHGPKGTWRHHARIPIRILSCSYHHWLVGSWYWCPTSVPCHQLWLAHQQRKLHSQVCNFTYYRVSIQGLVKISKNSNFAIFEMFTWINDDKLEQLLILMIFKW